MEDAPRVGDEGADGTRGEARARGGRGSRARRWRGAREIRARDRRARGGWATSRGCGYRWMNGWLDG